MEGSLPSIPLSYSVIVLRTMGLFKSLKLTCSGTDASLVPVLVLYWTSSASVYMTWALPPMILHVGIIMSFFVLGRFIDLLWGLCATFCDRLRLAEGV